MAQDSLSLEVVYRDQVHKLVLPQTATLQAVKQNMFDRTLVPPKNQKFIGWTRVQDNDQVSPLVRKKNRITMTGLIPKETSASSFQIPKPEEVIPKLDVLLTEELTDDDEVAAFFADLKKAALKLHPQREEEESFLTDKGVLERLVKCLAVTVAREDSYKVLRYASPTMLAELLDCFVQTLEQVNGSHPEATKIIIRELYQAALTSPRSFQQHHVNSLVNMAPSLERTNLKWVMVVFLHVSCIQTTFFAPHINFLIDQIQQHEYSPIPAYILTLLQKQQPREELLEAFERIESMVSSVDNNELRYVRGPALLVSIIGFSESGQHWTSLVNMLINELKNCPKKFHTVLLLHIFELAKIKTEPLIAYKEEITNQLGNDALTFRPLVRILDGSPVPSNALEDQLLQYFGPLMDTEFVLDMIIPPTSASTTQEEELNPSGSESESESDWDSSNSSFLFEDFESLKKHFEEHGEGIKVFLTKLSLKVPIPFGFLGDDKQHSTLRIQFVCCKQNEQCQYLTDNPFTIDSADWGVWLRVHTFALLLDKMMPEEELKRTYFTLNAMYDKYKDKKDPSFRQFMTLPVPPSEQEKLVNNLKAHQFYDTFTYDSLTSGWACKACTLAIPTEPSQTTTTTPILRRSSSFGSTGSPSPNTRRKRVTFSEAPKVSELDPLGVDNKPQNATAPSNDSATKPPTPALKGKSAVGISQLPESSIWTACMMGDTSRVRTLLASGVDVNVSDIGGRTPLHYACNASQYEVIKLLLASGANTTVVDRNYKMPYDCSGEVKSFILENMIMPPNPVPDEWFSECQICVTEWSIFNRRHHCRHCGRLVCAECSLYTAKLPSFGFVDPVRVCCECYPIIQRLKKEDMPESIPVNPLELNQPNQKRKQPFGIKAVCS